jgi:predicted HicB family RNase H-like nuclease
MKKDKYLMIRVSNEFKEALKEEAGRRGYSMNGGAGGMSQMVVDVLKSACGINQDK